MAGIVVRREISERISAAAETDSRIGRGMKIVAYSIIACLALRFLLVASEILCVTQEYLTFVPAHLVSTVVYIVLCYCVYHGVGALAYLPIVGGVVMLIQLVGNGYFEVLFSSDYVLLARIYVACYLLTALSQVLVFIYLLVNGSTKRYFAAYKKAQADVKMNLSNT